MCIISFLSKFCNAQVINVSNYDKYDSILKTNKSGYDTLIIWGKYKSYMKTPFTRASSQSMKLKKTMSKTAIQITLFETEEKVYYSIKTDSNLVMYNTDDLIKLELVICHELLNETGNKIVIVRKIL